MNFFFQQIFLPLVLGIASSAIAVFVGVENIKSYIKKSELRKLYGVLRSFWATRQNDTRYYIVFGCEPGIEEDFEPEPRIGYSQSFGVSEISRLLETLFGEKSNLEIVLLNRDDPFPKNIFNSNVIIVGGELVLKRFRQFNLDLNVPYYQHELKLNERTFTRKVDGDVHETINSLIDWSEKRIKKDIGTITRIINPINGKLIFLFNANYSAGLLGAILAATQKELFPVSTFDSGVEAQQLVVEVPNIQHNMITRQHKVFCRNWIPFNVDTKQIQSAITNATDTAIKKTSIVS
jgi:hypothetical protein